MGNIQLNDAKILRERFEKSNEICNHSFSRLKEYHLGISTGDYLCSNCYDVIK